jgi:hypothetical protein
MIHSDMTRWIEDADAREVLLQSAATHDSQEHAQAQYLHLGPTIKAVVSQWHHSIADHLLFHDHRRTSTERH